MIADHTISARAEKSQMVPAQRLARRILTASIAALLMLPSLAAWGTDRMPGKPGSADAFEEKIALPPIPHLESMPWITWNSGVNTPKVDTLTPPQMPHWLAPAPREFTAPSFSS
ncbi:hypothetical protein QA641_17600 [Bradyrhizobium sp. CB1650]|uniref:hypothetical protein n=1 Tax=Bradyrhizobium sp. CB1650 TaxID=3039153 RepID=UPI002435C8E2|nr:hypothetical protein [Bradyrhizobium sp. CB1650]WGD55535.1 hypothetical protein QA641_17600 [Bradyrhizobium sp. CB1650]